ncbi:MAG: hypothetical protein KDK78_03695, partial [Chlamydiia bacterium]|nr:hypothetical protein [Chlamydiia bacterium]
MRTGDFADLVRSNRMQELRSAAQDEASVQEFGNYLDSLILTLQDSKALPDSALVATSRVLSILDSDSPLKGKAHELAEIAWNALSTTSKDNNLDGLVKGLIKHDVDISNVTKGEHPIFSAIVEGRLTLLSELLAEDVSKLPTQDTAGVSLLRLAADELKDASEPSLRAIDPHQCPKAIEIIKHLVNALSEEAICEADNLEDTGLVELMNPELELPRDILLSLVGKLSRRALELEDDKGEALVHAAARYSTLNPDVFTALLLRYQQYDLTDVLHRKTQDNELLLELLILNQSSPRCLLELVALWNIDPNNPEHQDELNLLAAYGKGVVLQAALSHCTKSDEEIRALLSKIALGVAGMLPDDDSRRALLHSNVGALAVALYCRMI